MRGRAEFGGMIMMILEGQVFLKKDEKARRPSLELNLSKELNDKAKMVRRCTMT